MHLHASLEGDLARVRHALTVCPRGCRLMRQCLALGGLLDAPVMGTMSRRPAKREADAGMLVSYVALNNACAESFNASTVPKTPAVHILEEHTCHLICRPAGVVAACHQVTCQVERCFGLHNHGLHPWPLRKEKLGCRWQTHRLGLHQSAAVSGSTQF